MAQDAQPIDLLEEIEARDQQVNAVVDAFDNIVGKLKTFLDNVELLYLNEIKNQDHTLMTALRDFQKKVRYCSIKKRALDKYSDFVRDQFTTYSDVSVGFQNTAQEKSQIASDIRDTMQSWNKNNKTDVKTVLGTSSQILKSKNLQKNIVKQVHQLNAIIKLFSIFNNNLIKYIISYPLPSAPKIIYIKELLDKTQSTFGVSISQVAQLREKVESSIIAAQKDLAAKANTTEPVRISNVEKPIVSTLNDLTRVLNIQSQLITELVQSVNVEMMDFEQDNSEFKANNVDNNRLEQFIPGTEPITATQRVFKKDTSPYLLGQNTKFVQLNSDNVQPALKVDGVYGLNNDIFILKLGTIIFFTNFVDYEEIPKLKYFSLTHKTVSKNVALIAANRFIDINQVNLLEKKLIRFDRITETVQTLDMYLVNLRDSTKFVLDTHLFIFFLHQITTISAIPCFSYVTDNTLVKLAPIQNTIKTGQDWLDLRFTLLSDKKFRMTFEGSLGTKELDVDMTNFVYGLVNLMRLFKIIPENEEMFWQILNALYDLQLNYQGTLPIKKAL